MQKDEIAKAMPAIRSAFEALKENLREGRMQLATQALFDTCLLWGDELHQIYAGEDKQRLARRDPLTRFFVTRLRGMPSPADIADAPPAAVFLMAFTAFPYLNALVEEMTIGEHGGFDEDGNWLVRRVVADEDDGTSIKVFKAERDWRFDLMPVYLAKAQALDAFIATEFAGDFDAFLWRYVADHDLVFDIEQAWQPLGSGGRKMRVRVRDLSPPLAGVALAGQPHSAAEAQAVAGLVAMLEGSLLFGLGAQHEEQERCYRAVGEARRLVGETRKLLPDDAAAMPLLAAMRAACRKYIDEAEDWDRKAGRRFSMPTFAFYQLLGALREVTGLYVWRLCDAYDLEIEGRMAAFFPGSRD